MIKSNQGSNLYNIGSTDVGRTNVEFYADC